MLFNEFLLYICSFKYIYTGSDRLQPCAALHLEDLDSQLSLATDTKHVYY